MSFMYYQHWNTYCFLINDYNKRCFYVIDGRQVDESSNGKASLPTIGKKHVFICFIDMVLNYVTTLNC